MHLIFKGFTVWEYCLSNFILLFEKNIHKTNNATDTFELSINCPIVHFICIPTSHFVFYFRQISLYKHREVCLFGFSCKDFSKSETMSCQPMTKKNPYSDIPEFSTKELSFILQSGLFVISLCSTHSYYILCNIS